MSVVQVDAGDSAIHPVLREDDQEKLVFERLRESLEAWLDAHTSPDRRGTLSKMHEAMVEARVALDGLRDGVVSTEKKLDRERAALNDAVRRGKMATAIGDEETAAVAKQYEEKHAAHAAVLERKLSAQREELALAERELGQMRSQLEAARRAVPGGTGDDRIDAAWREIEAAGGVRPDTDLNDDLLRTQMDRAAREAAAEERLRQLKKKMGR